MTLGIEELNKGKAKTLENYKKAKTNLKIKNGLFVTSGIEWETFCKAKADCMKYGVRI